MVPVDIHRNTVLHWLWFGLCELLGALRAFFRREGTREEAAIAYVERHAVAGDPESVLRTMDEYAKKHRFLMNVGVEKGEVLERTLREVGAVRALELGAYCGYSAVLMGRRLKENGGTLLSIEADPRNASLARRVVHHAGLSDVVTIRVGKAYEQIAHLVGRFDLVFIDHWKDDYLSDLQSLESGGHLARGAAVVADNVGIFASTLVGYLDYVRSSPQYDSSHYPLPMEYNTEIVDGVEVSLYAHPAADHAA
ncbi:MAG: SAM-dependent methyltransferase [Deltaproteobacteria bacterium]|nr:SAM-dependent methyltransferase [Deltaproteobacteria bacterium]HCH66349.1 SAM-dependent methyltransferase [Deltaproteobacteria bacterium]